MRQALEIVGRERRDEVAFIVFTGCGPWAESSTRPDLDVPFYGAMGKAGAAGLGLALARPDLRVWVVDGDGSLLMNLGTLVTEAAQAPRNLVHMVLENGVYGTTGGQPIPGAGTVDFAAMAKAAGFPRACVFDDAGELEDGIRAAVSGDGPTFITLRVQPLDRGSSLPRKPTKQAIADVTAAIRRAPAWA